MLIRFEATNYRSIKAPVELSMVAIDVARPEVRDEPHIGVGLLPVAAIYGPNASGKSNLLDAISWLQDAIIFSMRKWEEEIPLDPFALNGDIANPTMFELEMSVEGIRFEYILELEREGVIYEGLFHYPEKKRRRIFERDSNGIKLQRGLSASSGIRKLLTKRTLALTIAKRFDEPLVQHFSQQVRQFRAFGQTVRKRNRWHPGYSFYPGHSGKQFTERLLEERSELSLFDFADSGSTVGRKREQALALLRMADLGISDVAFEEQETRFGREETRTERKLVLLHNTSIGLAPLDFEDESAGTQTWFGLVEPVLNALADGSVVLVDELGANLHPTLSAELIRLFRSSVVNPHGAQLIFTSHDTSLLNHLNRDEVWLTDKRADGSTRLGSLADFSGERVRKSQNLENAYLHGRFGALPKVDQYEFLRAFGLVG
jgi:AAA15 family ATPase/GTPase